MRAANLHVDILDKLTELPHLKYLDLSKNHLHMDIFEKLKTIPTLIELTLQNSKLQDAQYNLDSQTRILRMKFLFKKPRITLPTNLRSLDLSNNRLSDCTILRLTNCSQLESINLSYNYAFHGIDGFPGFSGITSRSISSLAKHCPKLLHLSLDGINIDDNNLEALAKLESLETLCLAPTNVGHEGLEKIAQFANLRHLCIGRKGTLITDQGLAPLTNLQNLEALRLLGEGITDACVDTLVQLPQLKFLTLEWTSITKNGIQKIKEKLPQLEEFVVDEKDALHPSSEKNHADLQCSLY
jgi:hypothetical protein